MKFNYQDIDTIEEFNLRWYCVRPDTAYPSITSVLGRTAPEEAKESLRRWAESIGQAEAERIGREAAENGTAVHLLAERFLKKEDLKLNEFTDQQIGSFNTLKTYLRKIEEVWGQEVPLFSDNLMVAGRCDCIAVYKGVPSIIDFKTSSKIKNDSMIEDYKYQLAFYAQAHNEMFGTNISTGVVLMTTKDGFPLEFRVDLNKYFNRLEDRVLSFYNILLQED